MTVIGRLFSRAPTQKHRVVIVGASFAGLSAAKNLGSDFSVTVVDLRDAFEFTPNIHELISGYKRPDELLLPLAPLIRRWGHRFRQDKVSSIDTNSRNVVLKSGDSIEYDTLIVAIGAMDTTFDVKGVTSHAWPFKSVDNCAAIGDELRRLLENTKPNQNVHIVIAGAGLEGIEALGEILRRYRRRSNLRIHLVEARSRLLPTESSVLDAELRRHCRERDVDVHVDSPIVRVTEDSVELKDGIVLPSDLTIWSGGIAPPSLLASSGLAAEGTWAKVRANLESLRASHVYIAGDAAEPPFRTTKQAYHGLDMGALCAENIKRKQQGRRPKRFKPSRKPTLIAFGDLDTFLVSSRIILGGTALAPLKESVFQLVLSQLAPPSNLEGMFDLAQRLRKSAKGLLAPGFGSLDGLIARPGVRVLFESSGTKRKVSA